MNSTYVTKHMILHQNVSCNHHCEMCDLSIQDNDKSDYKKIIKHLLNLPNSYINFLAKENIFSSEILVKTNLNY